jgi:hypothetical protein
LNGIQEVVGSIPVASNTERMSKDFGSGQLDPEIADLMGIAPAGPQARPEFPQLFQDEPAIEKQPTEQVDTSRRTFEFQTKLEEASKPFFHDKNYYKKLLGEQGEHGKRVHELLTQFAATEDPQTKSVLRARLSTAYWEMAAQIAARVGPKMPVHQRLLLRFGILSPSLLSEEQRALLCRLKLENRTGEPVHYQDEWLLKIAHGAVNPSATDEVKRAKQDASSKTREIIEKRRGQRQAELSLLAGRLRQLEEAEAALSACVKTILQHQTRGEFGGLKDAFSAEQREALVQIQNVLRTVSNLDRDVRESYSALENIDRELADLEEKSNGEGPAMSVDRASVLAEFGSLRQMSKMCVGRQGNHFPILLKQYFRPNIKEIATRENVINAMARAEALDVSLFERTFKGQATRIVPHVLLLPNYGETGICWEPFERFNRASSRGRIAIPLFPKDLDYAVLTALADLRWQVAKEKAQHYWMEEGITGKYYQWFDEQKLKGDVKDYFIRDYVLWITKESQGTQKLDREVRGIFWRNMPFPQAIKDSLKNRGFVYNELYKKDQNIAMSDGY